MCNSRRRKKNAKKEERQEGRMPRRKKPKIKNAKKEKGQKRRRPRRGIGPSKKKARRIKSMDEEHGVGSRPSRKQEGSEGQRSMITDLSAVDVAENEVEFFGCLEGILHSDEERMRDDALKDPSFGHDVSHFVLVQYLRFAQHFDRIQLVLCPVPRQEHLPRTIISSVTCCNAMQCNVILCDPMRLMWCELIKMQIKCKTG